jgi:hypothetical protein
LWDQQNQEVHGSTLEQQEKRNKTAMIQELKEIQTENHDMSASAKALIALDATRMEKMNNKNVETFLYSARIVARANRA